MRKLALAGLALLAGVPLAAAQEPARVAIAIDGPWDRNAQILPIFREEIESLLGDEFGVTVGNDRVAQADWTVGGVRALLDSLFAAPDVDVIVGIGMIVSNDLGRRESLPKPVVGVFVLDPELQGIPRTPEGTSGVPNLSYISSLTPLQRDLETFRDVVPFERLAFLLTQTALEAVPEIRTRIERAAAEAGVQTEIVPVGLDGAAALAAIPPEADAVYLAPLIRMPDPDFDQLVAGINERGLPSFSYLGRSEVRRGVLAGTAPEADFHRLARRTALNVQRILLGEDAGTLPVDLEDAERLYLNMATARAIGVSPPWRVLSEAELIDAARTDVARTLSLESAVREAVEANLDLAVAEWNVKAGARDVPVARSFLLPRLDASGLGLWIDSDQASRSFGQVAERSGSGSLTLTQVLYDDDAWTGYSVSRSLQIARERGRDRVRLDLVQAAATTYLDVLRAKTLERIQKDNLRLSQTNLELARVRESVGFSGPNEVYRWEGQVATARRDLVQANATRNVAEIALNRLLNRPLEEPFLTLDTTLDSPGIAVSDPRIRAFLADRWSFRVLRAFMAEEAISASPEIQALDAEIAAQRRVLTSTGRAFWVPSVGLSGDVTRTFLREGEGVEPPPGSEGPKDTEWNVGLSASLPLFTGGARRAERQQAKLTIDELETQRESLAAQIAQRVRSALHLAGSSYAAIELSREAADASRRNLDVVQDGYSLGINSIVELLDAQNAALVSELGAANAVYDFLIDLMEVERAAGHLTFFYTTEQFESYLDRLEAYRDERANP